jgi:SOS-response transcriptional repressor LexA
MKMGAYAISDKKPSSRTIPILGYIAAGLPIEVVEEQSSFIDVLGLPPKGNFLCIESKR